MVNLFFLIFFLSKNMNYDKEDNIVFLEYVINGNEPFF